MSNNQSLGKANQVKNDEFYTQLSDIEKELRHYQKHFKNKIVLCNCDDPRVSNFFKYFSLNFEKLGLKKLITTCYRNQNMDRFTRYDSDKGLKLEYLGGGGSNNDDIECIELESNGDFRSDECIEILRQADIVCTNPPFSLFREYVSQLMEYKKKFVIIGNQNNVTYKEVFPLIQQNKMWYGNHVGDMKFKVPDNCEPRSTRYWVDDDGQKWRSLGTICWFTNLDIAKRHKSLILAKKFNKNEYTKYDNYDAVNVNKIIDIPIDYKKSMGVPITFLDKYNPEQFEIIGLDRPIMKEMTGKITRFKIDGRELYARIIIRHKRTKK